MAKFHTNRKGESATCDAPPGKCPLGGEHFDTAEEAQEHFESTRGDQHLKGVSKKAKSADTVEVYRHPQGKVATIRNGELEITKDGRAANSSATVEKLRSGHGSWTRDEAVEADVEPNGTPKLSDKEVQSNYSKAQDDEVRTSAELKAVYQAQREYDEKHAAQEGRRFHIGHDENGKIGRIQGESPEPRGSTFVKKSNEQEAELEDAFTKHRAAMKNLTDRQTDVEEAGLGHTIPDDGNTVRVRSQAQKWLLKNELQGQISDGQWENASNNPWQDWSSAKVVVDPKNPGRNFNTRKDNYNLNAKSLLDAVGDRMVDDVKTRTKRSDYNEKTMRGDLADLKHIFKTKREPLG